MAVAVGVERKIFQGRLGTAIDVNSDTSVVAKPEVPSTTKELDYRVEKHENPDGLVASNDFLTDEDYSRIARGANEVWGKNGAFDQAHDFYEKTRNQYYGRSLLNRVRGRLDRLTHPRTIEISIPVPNMAKLRKVLATSIL